MTTPLICVDAWGGPFGPGAVIANTAREVIGKDSVFPVAMIKRGTEFLGLEELAEAVSKSSRDVLTFSTIPSIALFLDTLERINATNTLTKSDRDIVHRWPNLVNSEFNGRRVEVCTLDDCTPDFLAGFSDSAGRIFAKTLVKKSAGHGMVINPEEVISAGTNGLPVVNISGEISTVPVDSSEPLIVSQPIDIAEDDKGKIEYRSWIIDHALSCVGRYWHDNAPIDEPADDVLDFLERFTSAHRDILPKHYVLDFARTQSGQLVVVEVNFLGESGIAGDEDAKGAVLNRLFTSLKQV